MLSAPARGKAEPRRAEGCVAQVYFADVSGTSQQPHQRLRDRRSPMTITSLPLLTLSAVATIEELIRRRNKRNTKHTPLAEDSVAPGTNSVPVFVRRLNFYHPISRCVLRPC